MIIALDIGTKKVGIAKQLSGQVAVPVGTVAYVKVLDKLQEIHHNTAIDTVVVGDPGMHGEITKELECQINSLQSELVALGWQVERVSEMHTSALARRSGTTDVDAAAATLILETYLDQQTS